MEKLLWVDREIDMECIHCTVAQAFVKKTFIVCTFAQDTQTMITNCDSRKYKMKCSLMKCVLMYLKAKKKKLPTTTHNLDGWDIGIFDDYFIYCAGKTNRLEKCVYRRRIFKAATTPSFAYFMPKDTSRMCIALNYVRSEMAKLPKLWSLPVGSVSGWISCVSAAFCVMYSNVLCWTQVAIDCVYLEHINTHTHTVTEFPVLQLHTMRGSINYKPSAKHLKHHNLAAAR